VPELTGPARPAVRRVHVWVGGRVQGVFFRQQTAEEARSRGVGGWVRNLPDGRVEAVFEGPDGPVEELLGWVRQGTPWAEVAGVEVADEEPEGLEGFQVRG
jgi:acylphosphatase